MSTISREYKQEEINELLDVVFKLSAKDIEDKLRTVRNRPQIAKRRWFWELLQNAKDAVGPDETVDVTLQIFNDDHNKPTVVFSHNGNPFRYQDAKNLIFPYSDKDEEESDKSGRFGTGFLATHYLSKIIIVRGVYLRDGKPYDFEFTLDRSAEDKLGLAQCINDTWTEFRLKTNEKHSYNHSRHSLDTSFKYPINEQLVESLMETIDDIQTSLPMVLALIPKVNSVKIKDELRNRRFEYRKNQERTALISGHLTEVIIEKREIEVEGRPIIDEFNLILCSDGTLDIAVEVERVHNRTILKEIPDKHPVLFCAFPLIGAEEFPFPVVINSGFFIPKPERDGIWLGDTVEGKQNHEVFQKAVDLFKTLVDEVSSKNWENPFLLFKTLKGAPLIQDIDVSWFTEKIQAPLKEYLTRTPMVDNPVRGRVPIIGEDNKINFLHNAKKEIREAMWNLLFELAPHQVPPKNEVHLWYDVIWKECPRVTLESLAKFISGRQNVKALSEQFNNDESRTLAWLNDVVAIIADEEEGLLSSSGTEILPNQLGEFKDKDELYLDDGTIDDELKEIYATIGKFKTDVTDWRSELLDKRIYLELPHNKTRNIEDMARLIVEYTKDLLKSENPSSDLQDYFSQILNWLNDNSELRKNYFQSLKDDTLLYKTTDVSKLKYFTELLRKDRKGEISVEDIAKLDARKIALLNDPDLERKLLLGEQALQDILKAEQELKFKKENGDIFEKLFHEIINADKRFTIQKVEGEEDFIVTRTIDSEMFYIELKSFNPGNDAIQMTHRQAKKAHRFPSNYVLCFIPNNGGVINEDYFVNFARFDSNVGILLRDKVQKALAFEIAENGISVEFEDSFLSYYKKYRYKFNVKRNALNQDTFNSFKTRLLSSM